MRKQIFLFFALCMCFPIFAKAQLLYQCNENQAFWIISKKEDNYILELSGKVQESERKEVISVKGYVLQSLIVDKSAFTEEGSKDLQILLQYALNEAEYFSKIFKKKININFQKAVLGDNREVLLWFFDMPENITVNVKKQLFVNVIMEDKIVGLASSQLANQKFEDVRDFLTDMIAIFKKVEDKDKIKNPCK